eukprot:TCALIF_05259-PA protein Name:"Similar to use1 Vesicle transport protein USE1 (Danio rerio)" AED:0.05 eAED:0.05 QI:0/0.75/0.6/0.8/0.75/0.6/5/1028/284
MNLRALEKQCNEWISQDHPQIGQKTRANLQYIDRQVQALQRHPQAPSREDGLGYQRKIEFLRQTLDGIEERLPEQSPHHAPVSLGVDVPSLGLTRDTPLQFPQAQAAPMLKRTSPNETPTRLPVIRPYGYAPLPWSARQADPLAREIFQKASQRQPMEERRELLGQSDAELRQRKPAPVDGALEDLMKVHQDAQEQVAEEMLKLTRSLKEQSMAAGEIIRNDTASLERTNELAEANRTRLGLESERLNKHTQQLCRWWIWLIIFLVTVTFVAMVMIMKIFRKRW